MSQAHTDKTNCALCQIQPMDEESHIVPAFIYRWIKETSPTGFLRNESNQNLRVQDGEKYPLLCKKCEDHFSVLEGKFANKVFYPLTQSTGKQIFYDDSLLKFCVSILWRTLHHVWLHNPPEDDPLPANFEGKLEPVYNRWRQFLLGQVEHPGEYEVHLFPMGLIDGGNLPENPGRINTYLTRGTEITLISNRVRGYVYVYLPNILLLGRVYDFQPKFGECSRIRVRKGVIGSKNYKITQDIINYIFEKARQIEKTAEALSPKQAAKIKDAVTKNLKRLRNSECFEAGLRDFTLKKKQ